MPLTWRLLTPEEVAEWNRKAEEEHQEMLKRWPVSQRRPRCPMCGCWLKENGNWWDWQCKRCGANERNTQ